jgi:hypothetical protein
MRLEEIFISAFKNAKSTAPVTVTLKQFMNTDKYKHLIDQVRATSDKASRDELKKQLPAATISGTFSKRRIDCVTSYNGIVCIDIDAQDNPGIDTDEMKARICSYEQVLYCGISVGAKGVFALMLTDLSEHKYHGRLCALLERYIWDYDQLKIDPSCKDITRLRFVSYDTNAYLNLDAVPFLTQNLVAGWRSEDLTKVAAPPRPIVIPNTPKAGSSTQERVEHAIAVIEKNRLDITNDYTTWANIGFALASEFGSQGENYFQRISAFHPKYDSVEVSKKYHHLVGTNSGKVKIGTFFHVCKQSGI